MNRLFPYKTLCFCTSRETLRCAPSVLSVLTYRLLYRLTRLLRFGKVGFDWTVTYDS